MVRRGAGRQTDGSKWLGRSAGLGGVARRAVASANGIVTIGWTEAAFGFSGMVGPSCRRSVTLNVMPEGQSCDVFDIQSHRVLEASRS